jgi:hypothetical protein
MMTQLAVEIFELEQFGADRRIQLRKLRDRRLGPRALFIHESCNRTIGKLDHGKPEVFRPHGFQFVIEGSVRST